MHYEYHKVTDVYEVYIETSHPLVLCQHGFDFICLWKRILDRCTRLESLRREYGVVVCGIDAIYFLCHIHPEQPVTLELMHVIYQHLGESYIHMKNQVLSQLQQQTDHPWAQQYMPRLFARLDKFIAEEQLLKGLIPGFYDRTCLLHRHFYGLRRDIIECIVAQI